MLDPAKYPLRRTRDLRTAMAEALAKHFLSLSFSIPKTTKKNGFKAVFSDWPTFNKRAMTAGGLVPAATVLPDRGTYDDAAMTPRPLESTWWQDGRDGYVLWEVAEYECPMVVVVRALNKPQRKSIMLAVEESFAELGEPTTTPLPDLDPRGERFQPSPESPIRYGRLFQLEGYYNQRARFSLMAQQLLDSEETAGTNRWMAQVEILAFGKVLVLRRAPPLRTRIMLKVDDVVDSR